MMIFGVCFVLYLIKLSAEKGFCLYCLGKRSKYGFVTVLLTLLADSGISSNKTLTLNRYLWR